MSKAAHFLFIFFCLLGHDLSAQSSLALSTSSATAGSSASLNLTLTSPAGSEPSALQWVFNYPDSSLSGFTVTAGPALVAAGKSINCAGTGAAYICLAAGVNQSVIGNGSIATVAFSLASGAATVPVGVGNAVAVSLAGATLPIVGSGGGTQGTATIGVSSLQCAATSVQNVDTCTVSLTGAAPVGGWVVAISSTNPGFSAPASVTVSAGSASANFTLTAASSPNAQSGTVTASLGSSSASTVVSIAASQSSSSPGQLLQIQGTISELSGMSNGAVVTPTVAPAGFTGSLAVAGAGSVNFTPVQSGTGAYFLACCSNSNDAYYKFTSAAVGDIFNVSQGQITFYLKSRYSFAQRLASAAAPRYALDVRDGSNNHLFSFLTQTVSGYLQFVYSAAGAGTYYYVPVGTEDVLFGNGVTMKVTISWGSAGSNLYLNDNLVKSVPYVAPTPNWTAASNFDLGAYEYSTFGGYNACDDAISAFTVSGPSTGGTGTGGTGGTGTGGTGGTGTGGTGGTGTGGTDGTGTGGTGGTGTGGDGSGSSGGTTTPQAILQIHGDQSELSAVANGATITPAVAPAGVSGAVVINGGGSVNFAPAQTGNGVYFLNCCSNAGNAYYKFTGTGIGTIFNAAQGQITFYLKSRYNFAQRSVSAAAPRYAFDVRDGNNTHLFSFLTQTVSGYLQFVYAAGGAGTYYYVPAGTQDTLFGSGVTLKVTISWSSSTGSNLYLNDTLVKSVPYIAPTPSWTAASNFDLGAYEYFTFGGYNTSDDVIDEFTVLPTAHQ